jgi:endonuclease/exonuclease/phosphatase family metal-dependent hydrolase
LLVSLFAHVGATSTPGTVAGSADRQLPSSFGFLSQNLWLHYFVLAPNRSGRIQAFLTRLQRHDADQNLTFVCIQEAFLLRLGPWVISTHVDQLIRGMAALGFRFHSDPYLSLPRFFGQNSGLLVFSKLPLMHQDATAFAVSRELLNNKGFVAVTLASAGEHAKLTIVNTHLDSAAEHIRRAQVAQLGTYLQRLSAPDRALLVCGDLNICALRGDPLDSSGFTGIFSYLLEQFSLAALAPVFNATHRTSTFRQKPSLLAMIIQQLTWGCWQPAYPRTLVPDLALDHIFYSPGRIESVGPTASLDWWSDQPPLDGLFFAATTPRPFPVADHLGIIATLSLLGP